MDLITVDFETYYDREFSLSKITTEEYIRSPEFEVIGVAVKVNDTPTEWASGRHAELKEWLRSKFKWQDSLVLAHNTMFDGAILAWHYGIRPKGWLDTMCMARALHGPNQSASLKALAERYKVGVKGTEVVNAFGKRRLDFTPDELAKYGEYCVNDVNLTHDIFHLMVPKFPRQELRVIDLTLSMFIDPVLELDTKILRDHLQDIQAKKERLLIDCAADRSDLMSNPKFADLLRQHGVEPPTKISPLTGQSTFAFAKNDEEFKALAEHPNEMVQALVAARLGNKSTLEETRTERFLGIAGRGALPIPLRYYAAHTGRFGGDDKINMQNLPSRGQNANKLKRAIVAPEGYVLIDTDSSQIEARTLAWLAGQDDLVEAFANRQDVYSIMAAAIYGVDISEVTKEQRFVGKTTVLGCGYGMGALKFRDQLKTFNVDIDIEEARRIIDIYRRKNDRIVALWRQAQNALVALLRGESAQLGREGVLKLVPKEKAIRLPSGLLLRYDGLDFTETDKGVEFSYDVRTGRSRIYGGKCLSADTDVLTRRGWVPITEVTLDDHLWDGVEWVTHDGLTYQGEKATIVLSGVRLTPDHKVLTERGWLDASSCEGLHRTDIRLPDSNEVRGVRRSQVSMGVHLPLREESGTMRGGHGKVRKSWRAPLMWVYGGGKGIDPQNVKPSGVLGVAFYERQMSPANTSGMAQLRGARDICVRKVANFVRGLLGGHGAVVCVGVDVGSDKQRRPLQSGQLPLGSDEDASRQSARGAAGRHRQGPTTDGYLHIDTTVPMASEPVYDILNAGPRSRFVVRGTEGPIIVHNCIENVCQALATIIIKEQMLEIAKRYRVVLQVHDAVAALAREDEAEEARAYIETCMRTPPQWATGLPLNCESGTGRSYGDC